ncbi:uncharacterized protein LOC119686160 [Teleopsis dalmanni]|uniref:uncharacterized protein LOC119686160 n=1 Tax=Teleopsis dalmanni TaxID=139649 RepID=UPI0018CDF96D|nr:uncharacterized protein LOC119686160 [Teleopsis dalmanni]
MSARMFNFAQIIGRQILRQGDFRKLVNEDVGAPNQCPVRTLTINAYENSKALKNYAYKKNCETATAQSLPRMDDIHPVQTSIDNNGLTRCVTNLKKDNQFYTVTCNDNCCRASINIIEPTKNYVRDVRDQTFDLKWAEYERNVRMSTEKQRTEGTGLKRFVKRFPAEGFDTLYKSTERFDDMELDEVIINEASPMLAQNVNNNQYVNKSATSQSLGMARLNDMSLDKVAVNENSNRFAQNVGGKRFYNSSTFDQSLGMARLDDMKLDKVTISRTPTTLAKNMGNQQFFSRKIATVPSSKAHKSTRVENKKEATLNECPSSSSVGISKEQYKRMFRSKQNNIASPYQDYERKSRY